MVHVFIACICNPKTAIAASKTRSQPSTTPLYFLLTRLLNCLSSQLCFSNHECSSKGLSAELPSRPLEWNIRNSGMSETSPITALFSYFTSGSFCAYIVVCRGVTGGSNPLVVPRTWLHPSSFGKQRNWHTYATWYASTHPCALHMNACIW